MEKYKVSIIVAIYKSEKFLDKLINSIINQTYKNLEIILVDDGSPDNSGNICDEYSKKDSRIIVIHKENGGTCEARNYGLKNVTGDYITIIDGDDWLCEDYIEYLMKLILDTNSEMAMTDNIFTTRDQVQIKEDEIKAISPEEATEMLIYPIIPIGPWNKIYSSKLVFEYKIDFSVPWSGEGLYFTTTCAQRCSRVGLGHRKIYNYRLNNLQSGLTNYNPQIGINALWNIKNIKANLYIDSPKLIKACDWHIWKNYNFLLKLIVGTSIEDNRDMYNDCLVNIRKSFIKAISNDKLGFIEKCKIIFVSFFPVFWAKHLIKKEKRALKFDKMK